MRREYATRLHRLDRSSNGGRADIQVSKPDSVTVSLLSMSATLPLSTLVILVYVLGMVTGSALFGLVRSWIHEATRSPR
jgi:hypothetical protein